MEGLVHSTDSYPSPKPDRAISLASIVCAVLLCLRWVWRGAPPGLKRAVARKHPRMPGRAMFALLCLVSSKANGGWSSLPHPGAIGTPRTRHTMTITRPAASA